MLSPLLHASTAKSPLSVFTVIATLAIVLPALGLPHNDGATSTSITGTSGSQTTTTILGARTGRTFPCRFSVSEHSYDLCPLVGSSNLPSDEGASEQETTSLLNILNHKSLRIESAALAGHTLSLSVVESIEHSNGKLHGKPTISLLFTRDADSVDTALRISFFCDAFSDDAGKVIRKFSAEDGAPTIEWRTRHACQTMGTARLSAQAGSEGHEFLITEDREAEPINDEDPPGEGDEFVPQRSRWGTARQWVAGLLLFFGVSIICTSIIVTSPRVRFFFLEKGHTLLARVSPIASRTVGKIRPMARKVVAVFPTSLFYITPSFRQRDQRLVQWVEEDMALQEDFMVNGTGAYELDGEEWDGMGNPGEYIPLTYSPRYGEKVRSYGSTPLREMFGGPLP